MNKRPIKEIKAELAQVKSGKVVPGRVWKVTLRGDGTVDRQLLDPEEYRRGQAARADQEESLALAARRKLGVSQDQFAALFGVSAGTLRNWEQKRRQPTGAAALLLRVAAEYPDIVRSVAAAA